MPHKCEQADLSEYIGEGSESPNIIINREYPIIQNTSQYRIFFCRECGQLWLEKKPRQLISVTWERLQYGTEEMTLT